MSILGLNDWIKRLKMGGASNDTIAAKLKIPVAEVEKRLQVMSQTTTLPENGIDHLRQQFETLCLQYSLVGESLKAIGLGLDGMASAEDLRQIVTADKEETIKNLLSHFIVLRPFIPVDPQAAMAASLRQN